MTAKATPATTENAGTLKLLANGRHFAQFSTSLGRKGTTLWTCRGEDEAAKRQLEIAALVGRLRASGHTGAIEVNTIKKGGSADAEDMRKLARLVDRIATGKEPGLARQHGAKREGLTVEQLAELWTTGKLAKEFPDHVRRKGEKQSTSDARMLEWLGRVRLLDGTTFGARPIAAVTLEDCDTVMGALPKSAASSWTRRHYAQTVRKLLQYGVYPLRLRESLPIPKGWLPKASCDKAKAWIYPAEDLALLRCQKVPLARRLLFGLLSREGLRVSEALRLTWTDLDLDRGVLRLDENKTDDPRSWALGEDVARALEAYRKLRGSKAKRIPRVFTKATVGHPTDLARLLREGLELANVKRPELIKAKPGRMLLRAHDLRGSFVTLALAAGQTEAWVTDRTGHRSSQMIYLYKRASRTAAELGLGWFAALDEAIPELAPKGRRPANGLQTGGPTGSQRSRGRTGNPGRKASSASAAQAMTSLLSRRSCVRITSGVPAVPGGYAAVGARLAPPRRVLRRRDAAGAVSLRESA